MPAESPASTTTPRLLAPCLAALLVGCLAADPRTDDSSPVTIRIPWPHHGDRFGYDGGDLEHEGVVRGLQVARDARGNTLSALRVDIVSTMLHEGRPHRAPWSELLDAEGHRFLVASRCASRGMGFDAATPPCGDSADVSATYLEWGLPGLAGASWFSGETLAPGVVEKSWALFRETERVRYEVRAALPREGAACVELLAKSDDLPVATGQRFSALASPPTRLVLCDGLPVPVEATIGPRLRLTLASFTRGDAPLAPAGLAADPWSAPPHPERERVVGGLPPRADDDPTGFGLRESAAAALAATEEGKRFRERHPDWVLRKALVTRWGSGTSTALGVLFPDNSYVEREIVLEGGEGEGFRATTRKTCEGGSCAVEVSGAAPARLDAPRVHGRDLASVPYPRAQAIASAVVGPLSGCRVGSVLWDAGKPDFGSGDTFFFTCDAEEPASGVPNHARVDGLTGVVLEMKGPRARVVEKIGVAP